MADILTELPLMLEYMDEGTAFDVWVVFIDRREVLLHNVTSAVRYRGWWTIDHEWLNRRASAYFEDARISHFRVLERPEEGSARGTSPHDEDPDNDSPEQS